MKKSLAFFALFGISMVGLSPVAAAQDTVEFTATLSGANEIDDPGDTDGSGSAAISIDVENTQICFDITVAGIEAATAGHIHTGAAGSNGAVVVDFNFDATNTKACVDSDTALIASIIEAPAQFYVNVHNEDFPSGAIRGQLAAAAPAPAATPEPTATPEAATTATTTTDDTAAADDADELAFTGDFTGYIATGGAALLLGGAAMVVAGRRQD